MSNYGLGFNFVLDFTNYNNELILAGEFNSINGSPYGSYGFIATWNDTSWTALGTGLNAPIISVTVFNNELYAGGLFTATGDNITPLNHIAKWDGTQWLPVGEGLNDTIYTLFVDTLQNKLYAGGTFTQTGLGVQAKHIAQWTGTNWQELNGGTNAPVTALFSKDSNLYVGGYFTQVGSSISANHIACWGYHNPTAINERKNNQELTISPNPSTALFTIQSKEKINQIRITNTLGQCVWQTLTPLGKDGEGLIDLTEQPKGIYFAEIKTDKGTTNKKIILQ
jgi:hypothetical protein